MPGSLLAERQSLHPAGPGNTLARQERCISSKSHRPAEAALSSSLKGERKMNLPGWQICRLSENLYIYWHLVFFSLAEEINRGTMSLKIKNM